MFDGVRMSLEIMERAKTSYTDMAPLLVGPGCFEILNVGHFIKYYNFVSAIEHVPNTAVFRARSIYSNAFTLSESLGSLYASVGYFIKANGWNRVFLLSDSMPIWNEVS